MLWCRRGFKSTFSYSWNISSAFSFDPVIKNLNQRYWSWGLNWSSCGNTASLFLLLLIPLMFRIFLFTKLSGCRTNFFTKWIHNLYEILFVIHIICTRTTSQFFHQNINSQPFYPAGQAKHSVIHGRFDAKLVLYPAMSNVNSICRSSKFQKQNCWECAKKPDLAYGILNYELFSMELPWQFQGQKFRSSEFHEFCFSSIFSQEFFVS